MEVPNIDARFLPPQVQVSNSIRQLWVDIIRLIRIYITRTLFNVGVSESKEAVNERLAIAAASLRDQLAPFFGEDISIQVQANLLEFLYHIEQMIDAYAVNDQAAIAEHRGHLYFLANNYAQSYAVMSRYYDRDVIQELFYAFIDSVENQVVSLINKDYARDLEEYERFVNIAYRLADEFIYGILRDFFYIPN